MQGFMRYLLYKAVINFSVVTLNLLNSPHVYKQFPVLHALGFCSCLAVKKKGK